LALLAAFEDSVTGMRVRDFCQDLAGNLGGHCQIIEHIWLFNTFRLRELLEIAAEEASASDLVIISVHQAEELPDEVKSWIELWLSHIGNNHAVLLALFDPAYEQAPGATQTYLQDVAQRGGLKFQVETREAPTPRGRGR
jgi:hypothetical protein